MIYLLVSWCLQLRNVISSNLDIQSPLIIEGGQKGSLFGYSVLQHNISNTYVFLISAPRANTTQDLVEPGAVFKCGIKFSEYKLSTKCEEWLNVFDEADDDIYSITNISSGRVFSTKTETKSNQFLGVTLLKSQTSVIACAHLYKDHYEKKLYRIDKRLPIGRCSFVDLDLATRQGFMSPCKNIADSHESYGSCLAGFSAAEHEQAILISAPNANGGYGNSFLYKAGINTLETSEIRELLTSTWAGTRAYSTETETSDYAGYSTVFCDVNGDGRKELILGMPRSYYYRGSIRIHYGTRAEQRATAQDYETTSAPEEVEQQGTGGNPDTSVYRNLKILCPTDDKFCEVPLGDHMGSYYGHSLACADLNGDGLDDLVISAPYHSNKTDNKELGDRGKVTVYFGVNETEKYHFPFPNFLSRKREDLFGSETAGGLFGYSLNTQSDLNNDGVKDLIIGAPYEDAGKGAIYVFNGGNQKDGFFDKKFSQKITPLDLGEDLQTFGSSISGGSNVDNIGGEDLIVGAFKSDKAVSLRTIPVVDIIPTLILLHPIVNLENATYIDPTTGEATVGNTLRINISTVGVNLPNDLELRWKITLDPINRNTEDKRAYMKLNRSSSAVYHHEGSITLQSDKVVTLPEILNILLKRKTIRNIKNLDISIHGQIIAKDTFTSKTALKYELFRSAKTPIKIETKCNKETGICSSDVAVTKLQISSPQNYDQIVIGEVSNVYVDTSIVNKGPLTAYDTRLHFHVPPFLSFYDFKVSGEFRDLECLDLSDSVVCEVVGGFEVGERNLTLKFLVNDTRLIANRHDNITANITVQLPSQDTVPTNNQQQTVLHIRHLADLQLLGGNRREKQLFNNKVINLSRPGNFREIGPEVIHLLEVRIDELARVNVIQDIVLEVNWPLMYGNKHVLYITDIHIPELYEDMISCDRSLVDQLNLGPADNSTTSVKSGDGAPSLQLQDEASLLGGGETSVNCNNIPCHVFRCHIAELERGANNKSQVKLEIRARMWETTFDRYYKVDVTSVSRVVKVGNKLVLPHQKIITKSITSKFYVPNKRKSVNLVIILLSVLAGLVILAGIVFVLYKRNFFKTGQLMRTPDDMFQTGYRSETLNQQVFSAS